MKVLTSIIAVIWLSASYCYGQKEQSTELLLYFKGGSSRVDLNHMGNRATLSRMTQILTPNNVRYFESIDINGYASPEGVLTVNDRLAAERAAAVKLYIASNYPYLPQDKITTRGAGVDWDKLRKLVEADLSTPNREKILDIIDNVPAAVNVKTNISRKKSLMDLGTPTWNYMLHNQFPLMRVSASMAVILKPETPREVQEARGRMPHIAPEVVEVVLMANASKEEMAVITTKLDSINALLSRIDRVKTTAVPQNNLERVEEMIRRTEAQMEMIKELKTNSSDSQVNRELDEIDSQLQDIHRRLLAIKERLLNGTPIPEKPKEEKLVQIEPQIEVAKKSLFAIKTNLLFDATSMLNVEIEIPIGERWSIAAEYIFPWWLWEKTQYCLQTLSGNIGGRYWLGNRDNKPQLTGWFAGLYAGGGYYNLEWDKKGYQGEFYIAGGVSAGYAHTINKKGNLRMEYALGVGSLQTQYRQYEAQLGSDGNWHLMHQQDGKYTWFGPTRAKVSLVWMLNRNKKGGVK